MRLQYRYLLWTVYAVIAVGVITWGGIRAAKVILPSDAGQPVEVSTP